MRGVALSVVAIAATGALAQAEEAKPTFTPTEIKAAFIEQFTDGWADRWTRSEATKKSSNGEETFSYVGQWEVEEPSISVVEGEKGLVAKTKAAHHAISAPFAKSIDFSNKPLVVQYEVKYQKGGNCGGGYLKLLEDGFQTSGKEFSDTTPWVVMFGPDLTCPGTKLHFIFRHTNPVSKKTEEKHLKFPPRPTIEKLTNLYTLIVHPNNTYDVWLNGESTKTGNLLEDFDPAVNPTKEIDDPEDKKPGDWVDEEKISDPDAKKPGDWDEDAPYEILDMDAQKPDDWLEDEPATILDPDSTKPEEWDDEEDGEWVPPTVPNPKCEAASGCGEWKRPHKANPDYKGKWYAPLIPNPAYKGPWAPRKIPNPDYFEDKEPIKSLPKIGGVGIELWTMTEDILFNNFYIGHSIDDAKKFADETFAVKKPLEVNANKPVASDDEEDDEAPAFKEDPVGFVRQKIVNFVDAAKENPIEAFKSQPETGAFLTAVFLTLFGMIGAFLGLIGGSKPTITTSKKATDPKKTDAATPDDKKKTETTPVAPAGGEKKDDGSVKKRK
ncbi:hypothetical protein APHAL10511_002978 [Amanita phalloides]|nr:hypothetical protein APHAL10511_002978 [Amanita phalloides]